MSPDNGPRPLRLNLEHLLKSLGAPEINAISAIVDRWPEVVGPELASRVRAVAVRGSEVVVQVEDPGWASQIDWLESRLLERISDLIGPGCITAVRARVVLPSGPPKSD